MMNLSEENSRYLRKAVNLLYKLKILHYSEFSRARLGIRGPDENQHLFDAVRYAVYNANDAERTYGRK